MTDELVARLQEAILKTAECYDGNLYNSDYVACACLAAIEASKMVVVPREPTKEMLDYSHSILSAPTDPTDCQTRAIWTLMIEAAAKRG
jgi:hypothetical protein